MKNTYNFKIGDFAIIAPEYRETFPDYVSSKPVLFVEDSDKWEEEFVNISIGKHGKIIKHSLNPAFLKPWDGPQDNPQYKALKEIADTLPGKSSNTK